MNEWVAFALGFGVFALGYGLGAWISTRHRAAHRTIVVLDDFERSDEGMTLITHTACASCGERQRLPEIQSPGVEALRQAQAGER